jgi:hypothetical protein
MKKALSVLVVLFISFQLNAQWVQTNGPYGTTICLLEVGTNIYAGTNIGVFRSTNNGTSWIDVTNDLPFNDNSSITSLAISGNNIFAGVQNDLGAPRGLFLSTNNGTNWVKVTNDLPESNIYVGSLAVSGTNIFLGTWNRGVYLSTNNGTNWTQTGLGNNWVNSLAINGTNIFAGTYYNGVYLSTNNGTNWTQVSNGLRVIDSTQIFGSLAFIGNNVFVGSSPDGIFLSTNNGTNWTKVNNGLPSINISVTSFAISGTNIFASTDSGVFLSTNTGTNWTNVSDNLNINIGFLVVMGTNIYAATGLGVWRRPIAELTGVSNEVKVLPQEYTLFQNYPNPFNPSTVIKYAIPFESNINIRFYNSLGQIVREVNEGNRQPGNYEINFNSSGLASGIYFYSIKAVSSDGKNDFSAVKKMILLK